MDVYFLVYIAWMWKWNFLITQIKHVKKILYHRARSTGPGERSLFSILPCMYESLSPINLVLSHSIPSSLSDGLE